MLHNFTDGSTIDILAIENGDTDVAISALTSGRLTVETLTFVIMVALISHVPEFAQLSNEITTSNPLHGILYHYVLANFICHGCMNALIPALPGLSTASAVNGQPSQCERVKQSSEQKMVVLQRACADRGLSVPDFDAFFFQYHEVPGVLRGDEMDKPSGFGVEGAPGAGPVMLAAAGGGDS